MQPTTASAKAASPPVLRPRAFGGRPLVPLCLMMMLGIACGPLLPLPPAVGFTVFLGLCLACFILFSLKKNIKLLIALLAFVAGYALLQAALPKWASDPWTPPGDVRISGRIVQAGVTRSGYSSYLLDRVTVDGAPVEGRVAVTVRGTGEADGEGDTLTAVLELKRPETSRYFGDFNARGWYMRQGVRFTAFANEARITRAINGNLLTGLPARTRLYADGVLKTYLEPQNAALVDALLSGDTSDISQENRDAFRDLGVAHLLAVSGLNISLTAGAVWLLCRKLKLPMPVSLGLSFAALLVYALFAGLTPSVVRAAAMWAVMMGGMVFARRYDPLSSLSAAAILILALNPLDLFDAGFQLSFAATAAIFLWYAYVMKHAPKRKVLKALFSPIALTVCATLFMLPIILGCFNQISLISPLANLVLVPSSFVMQLGGTALLFAGVVPGAAKLLGDALNAYASFYLQGVTWLTGASMPVHAATPALWVALGFLLLALLVSPPILRMRRKARIAGIAALALVSALMLSPASASLSWQSEAAVVSEGNSSLSIFWRGGGGDYAACGQSWEALAGYLRSRGISRLKGLYVLRASPPGDGAMLEAGSDLRVDHLYVPGAWLADPEAQEFLGQAERLGMRPSPAETGPFPFTQVEVSTMLSIPAPGGTLAFVPRASLEDFSKLAPALAEADAAVLNVSASRAGRLLEGMPLRCLVLPGAVEGQGYPTYNSTACGSVEIVRNGGSALLLPWRDGRDDGLQGNFR